MVSDVDLSIIEITRAVSDSARKIENVTEASAAINTEMDELLKIQKIRNLKEI